jgi:hypothetical protein
LQKHKRRDVAKLETIAQPYRARRFRNILGIVGCHSRILWPRQFLGNKGIA